MNLKRYTTLSEISLEHGVNYQTLRKQVIKSRIKTERFYGTVILIPRRAVPAIIKKIKGVAA